MRLYREHYPEQRNLLLLTKGINQVDLAGAELLATEARERKKMGGQFYMYRMKPSATKVLDSGGFQEVMDPENIFDSKDEAISGIFERLDKDICRTCDKRIFLECDSVPRAEADESNKSPTN